LHALPRVRARAPRLVHRGEVACPEPRDPDERRLWRRWRVKSRRPREHIAGAVAGRGGDRQGEGNGRDDGATQGRMIVAARAPAPCSGWPELLVHRALPAGDAEAQAVAVLRALVAGDLDEVRRRERRDELEVLVGGAGVRAADEVAEVVPQPK